LQQTLLGFTERALVMMSTIIVITTDIKHCDKTHALLTEFTQFACMCFYNPSLVYNYLLHTANHYTAGVHSGYVPHRRYAKSFEAVC